MLRTKYSEEIEKQMKAYFDTLNEKDRRGYAAIEAMKLGHGGQNYISSVLGCHFQTVMAGINEITNGIETPENRIRKPGGGKKKIIETVENIDEVFFEILKDHTARSPMDKEIKWTNLSLKEISKAFESKSMNITPHVVKQLLKKHGFVERKMQKTVTMKDCKDRNEQFEKIQYFTNWIRKSSIHYDFKHLTEKYFEIGMKLNDFSIQLEKYCNIIRLFRNQKTVGTVVFFLVLQDPSPVRLEPLKKISVDIDPICIISNISRAPASKPDRVYLHRYQPFLFVNPEFDMQRKISQLSIPQLCSFIYLLQQFKGFFQIFFDGLF